MDAPSLDIYNLPPAPPRWDKIGIFYISFCAIWTTIVLGGMAFCWYHRHMHILRIRGLPLAFGSIISLHAYWILAQLTYPIGGTMPVLIAYDTQYFVMGIWFPLGMALFHAANMRFLDVAKSQRQYIDYDMAVGFSRISRSNYASKRMWCIAFGMVVQVLLCVSMWLACKKYHPSFGVRGTELHGTSLPDQFVDLGRGWEWWPSVFWQIIWTWIVAPISLWRAWGIRDTMGWQTQTIGACLSGLHATPMFLVASYVPAFDNINMYFAPSQWLHLSTLFIEIFTIFIPAYQVMRSRRLSRLITSFSADSDRDSRATSANNLAPSTEPSTFELAERRHVTSLLSEVRSDRLYSMATLTRVLSEYPEALKDFASNHDFCGENVVFLLTLEKWKDMFPKDESDMSAELQVEIHNAAIWIYIDFASDRYVEKQLNISSVHRDKLKAIFEAPAQTLCGAPREVCISPFEFKTPTSGDRERALSAKYTGPIAEGFGKEVFDEIQEHVKDLLLLNTWPKFVREILKEQRRSLEAVEDQDEGEAEGVGEVEAQQRVKTKKSRTRRVVAFFKSLV